MSLAEALLLVLYFGTIIGLTAYGVHRCWLLWLWLRTHPGPPRPADPTDVADSALPSVIVQPPSVTVQVPLFDERYVAERVIDAVARLDYPRDRLEIQILDDSDDDTCAIAERCVEGWRRQGVPITYLHRDRRTGYKAGALQAGLEASRGDFIAIFDADFVPAPDFLRRVMPAFTDDHVGVVQARWTHLNRRHSLLTRAQAILLDGHFVIEHAARHRSGRFFNFNGTAGVWRRRCLEDAGGWQHDTLTEDLDLSYRAQLRGWRFVFLPDVAVPAELPSEIAGFKSQQHRWAKGSIQTALKLGPRILAARVPWRVKAEAAAHLTANLCYPILFALSVLLLPILWLRAHVLEPDAGLWFDGALFFGATVSITVFYSVAARAVDPDRWLRRLAALPVVFAIGIGLSVNNTRAVLEALLGHVSPFVRTPKHAITSTRGTWRGKLYLQRARLSAALETALGLYLVATLAYALDHGFFVSAGFISLFALGNLYVGILWTLQTRLGAAFNRKLRPVDVVAPAAAN